jgi:outer membrane protein W
MKKISILSLVALFSLSLFSTRSYSQVYEPGNVVIDAYYGWPNLFTAVVKSAYESDPSFDQTDIKIGSIGPLGGKFEYVITPHFGVGLNVNYANTSVKGTTSDGYAYKASVPRLRVLPTVSIHIGSSTNIDPYVALGVGYSSMKIKETTDDPNYQEGDLDLKATPVAFRAEFGIRYFFIPNLGVTGQIGFGGGPLLAAGLAAKF